MYQAKPNGFFHINYDSINTVINNINDFLSNLPASSLRCECSCVFVRSEDRTSDPWML